MEILQRPQTTQIAEYVKCWGGAASITFLDSVYQFFSDPSIDGIIGYREAYNCAVVMGDPLTTEENKIPLAKAFKEFCKQKKLSIIYVTASASFAKQAYSFVSQALIEVVDELILDPQNDPKIGSKGRLLRGKVSQGIRFGLTAHEYTSYNEQIEEELEEVGKSWVKNREGPQIYLSPVNLFSSRIGKRHIYAKYQNKIIGVILLHQIQASRGWLLQLLLTTPDAPNGTSEFLVSSVIDILKKEGCQYLSFGSAQKTEMGLIKGLNKASSLLARFGYKAAKKIFPLDGRRKYWEKFSPLRAPSYVLFEKSYISFKEIGAIMKALNVKI